MACSAPFVLTHPTQLLFHPGSHSCSPHSLPGATHLCILILAATHLPEPCVLLLLLPLPPRGQPSPRASASALSSLPFSAECTAQGFLLTSFHLLMRFFPVSPSSLTTSGLLRGGKPGSFS